MKDLGLTTIRVKAMKFELPEKDQEFAEMLRRMLLSRVSLEYNVRLLLLGGYFPDDVASSNEVAKWLEPIFRGNLPALIVARLGAAVARVHKNDSRGGKIARAVYFSLSAAEQQTATTMIKEVVADATPDFYVRNPEFSQECKKG